MNETKGPSAAQVENAVKKKLKITQIILAYMNIKRKI